jgi:hypothetical protein
MKRILKAALLLALTGPAAATPVTLNFDTPNAQQLIDLPYSKLGFDVFGDGALIEGGLADEFFDKTKRINITRDEGLFSLLSFVVDRRSGVSNRFWFSAYRDGKRVWATDYFDYSDQQGEGALTVLGFDTPKFDEFRIRGVGPIIEDDSFDNIVFLDSITFDLDREGGPAPVPLPAGIALMLTAFGALSLRRMFT